MTKVSIEESNKMIVKRWLEEGWNQRNQEIFYELLSEDFVNHCTGRDLERMKSDFQPLFEKKHPTSRVIIEDMVAEGDKVAIKITHQGEPCIELVFCILRDGRITDVWNCFGKQPKE